jgi:acetaldehyde dehydrogenase (acetylating)
METPIFASSKTEPHPSQQKSSTRDMQKSCQTSSPRMSGRTTPQFESTELLNLGPHAGTIAELKTSSFGQIQGHYP